MKKNLVILLLVLMFSLSIPFAVLAEGPTNTNTNTNTTDERVRLVISCEGDSSDSPFDNITNKYEVTTGKTGNCAVYAEGNLNIANSKKITNFTFSFPEDQFGEKATIKDNDADDISLLGDIKSDSIVLSAGNSKFVEGSVLFYIENVTFPDFDNCTYDKNTGKYYYQYKFKTLTYSTDEKNNPQYSGILNHEDNKLYLLSSYNFLDILTVNGVTPQNFDTGSKTLKLKVSGDKLDFYLKSKDKTAIVTLTSTEPLYNIKPEDYNNPKINYYFDTLRGAYGLSSSNNNYNELKVSDVLSYYGTTDYKIVVIPQSEIVDYITIVNPNAAYREYTLIILKNIDLFAGRTDFEFDLENYTYTYNVPENVKYFGTCTYEEKEDFVANDELLCVDDTLATANPNLGIQNSIFKGTLSVNGINPYNEAGAMNSKTRFEKLNNSVVQNDHETTYNYLMNLKEGENILKFKLNNEYGYYTVKVVRGGTTEGEYKEGDNSNTHVDSEGNTTKEESKKDESENKENNEDKNKETGTTSNEKDNSTLTENPETGVVISIASLIIVAGGCVGAYIYMKKHDKFPQFR